VIKFSDIQTDKKADGKIGKNRQIDWYGALADCYASRIATCFK